MTSFRLRAATIGFTAVSALALSSCVDKVVNKIAFAAFSTQKFTVDFVVPIVQYAPLSIDSVATPGEAINLDSVVRAHTNNQFNVNDVTGVYVDKLSIDITNADAGNNLQNFEGVRLTLKSADDAVAPVEICNAQIPDQYADRLDLAVYDDRNLKPILASPGIIYLAGVSARRNTTKELTGKLTFSFDVK
jgi:hypothetical protein